MRGNSHKPDAETRRGNGVACLDEVEQQASRSPLGGEHASALRSRRGVSGDLPSPAEAGFAKAGAASKEESPLTLPANRRASRAGPEALSHKGRGEIRGEEGQPTAAARKAFVLTLFRRASTERP